MSFDLTDRTALVTGASRGIGRAIALAYAAAGADVALLARDANRLAEVAAEVEGRGRNALVLTCDVTDDAALSTATDDAYEAFGRVDVLVNNAGGNNFMSPFTDLRMSGWDKVMRLNLDSTVRLSQIVGRRMVEARGGSVINVASVAGIGASPLMAHYGAAKAAVVSLTRTLAIEWAWAGVRVNALVPGWIETDLTDFARQHEEIGQGMIGRVPMQRWGRDEEIAGPAVFLASDAASFITGHTLVVDGGLTVNP
ncbi:MAG: SDR family NAD(P)-dependent oxidoreductase [Candidatus Nanopelagicales bacterium]